MQTCSETDPDPPGKLLELEKVQRSSIEISNQKHVQNPVKNLIWIFLPSGPEETEWLE